MNYPAPVELHDYRYLGDTFRERERLKKISENLVRRFRAMPVVVITGMRQTGKSAFLQMQRELTTVQARSA